MMARLPSATEAAADEVDRSKRTGAVSWRRLLDDPGSADGKSDVGSWVGRTTRSLYYSSKKLQKFASKTEFRGSSSPRRQWVPAYSSRTLGNRC